MRGLKKSRKDELLSSASSPSLRSLGQDRQPQRMPNYIPTYNSKSKSFLPLATEDRDRDREKGLEREKSREKLDRESQFSKKWEDHLGFSITLSSGRDKSKNRDRDNSREDRKNAFIPTSREEAEQAGMKVICINFRVQPAGEADKAVGQDGTVPKTRRYTSTGPSLALLAGGMKVKTKTTTVIDTGTYTGGEPSMDDFGGIPVSSSRPTVTTTAGTGSVTASPISIPTSFAWGLFGSVRLDDRERRTTERRKAANDDLGSLPPLPRLEKGTGNRSTEFGGEIDEAGYAVIIPERVDSISSSLLTTARPTVVVPATTTSATTSPKSQPEHENDKSHSDSSSSISVSSLVFAHTSPNDSDIDDESFKPRGGAATAMSGRHKKGYPSRHIRNVQAQMKKTKNEGGGDERYRRGGVANAAEIEVNSKFGDAGHPQQAGKERNKDEERDGWIALDMVNDNGSFKFSYIYMYILI